MQVIASTKDEIFQAINDWKPSAFLFVGHGQNIPAQYNGTQSGRTFNSSLCLQGNASLKPRETFNEFVKAQAFEAEFYVYACHASDWESEANNFNNYTHRNITHFSVKQFTVNERVERSYRINERAVGSTPSNQPSQTTSGTSKDGHLNLAADAAAVRAQNVANQRVANQGVANQGVANQGVANQGVADESAWCNIL